MDQAIPRLLLTDQERERFAAYLEMEAQSDEAIIRQMESIRAPDVLIKKVSR